MTNREDLLADLDSFDIDERAEALVELIEGDLSLPAEGTNVNMHMHSFFSYNARERSPARLVLEARQAGLYAAGLCDFDVLDGMDEFLAAGTLLGLRTAVHVETRVFVSEFSHVDINSPGEPGVAYIMGAGFARMPKENSPQDRALCAYRERARTRNEELVRRINAALGDIALNYEADVLPLTPSDNATERHIVTAYLHKAMKVFQHPEPACRFWAGFLDRDEEEIVELMADLPRMEETVRAKLIKRGGIGYVQPTSDTFPPAEQFLDWARSCGAIPMVTWLDGTSGGESDAVALLECMRAKGAVAVNIVPDRNWNIADARVREIKTARLREIVEAATRMDMPINIGTEMNRPGLPFADDLDGPALRPFKEVFLSGARIMVGHTLLSRYANYAYVGEQAEKDLPDTASRNDFFEKVGALPPLTDILAEELESMGPSRALERFRTAVR